jgi:hypothetical protein
MGLKSLTAGCSLSLCVRSGSFGVYVHLTGGIAHSCDQMLCTSWMLLPLSVPN